MKTTYENDNDNDKKKAWTSQYTPQVVVKLKVSEFARIFRIEEFYTIFSLKQNCAIDRVPSLRSKARTAFSDLLGTLLGILLGTLLDTLLSSSP